MLDSAIKPTSKIFNTPIDKNKLPPINTPVKKIDIVNHNYHSLQIEYI